MTSAPQARILIAPDSFGDTLSAVSAADAIAAGWSSVRGSDEVRTAPQSDGGPGFVDVLAAYGGTRRTIRVAGPLGVPVDATWLYVPAAEGQTQPAAYIECAQACGLHLLDGGPTIQTAIAADTRGVGELIDDALAAGVGRIVVGLGGSATTDGGRGMTTALGGLADAGARLHGIDLVVATDVNNPLLGTRGAASVFAPQKGADEATVAFLDDRLTQWNRMLTPIADRDVSGEAGAGAAGGLGAALFALGGQRVSGADVVASATRRGAALAAADLLITGEGRLDEQTLGGKVIAALAAEAREVGVPVLVLAGQVCLSPSRIRDSGIGAAHAIVEVAGSVEAAMNDASTQLTRLAARVAETWTP